MAGNLFNCFYVSVILFGSWHVLRLPRQFTAKMRSYPGSAGGLKEGVL